MIIEFFLIIQVMLIVTEVSGDIFTSLAKLEPLIATEEQLLMGVQEYLHHEKRRIDSLERLVHQIQQERGHTSSSEGVSINLGHPIQSHQLIRRLRRQWLKVKKHVNETSHQKSYLEKFQQLANSSSQYPSNEDYKGSINALLRLQDTYALRTSSMADGIILGEQQASPLLPADCFDIGDSAWNIGNDDDANRVIEWMEEALKRELQSEEESTENLIPILQELAYALYQKGDIEGALEIVYRILEIDPENSLAIRNKYQLERKIKFAELDDAVTEDEDERYKALCRGDQEAYQKPGDPGEFLCRYNHYNNPRLLIRPAKEEILFTEPRVVYYHDIITDKEIEVLKQRSLPEMQRALVYNGVSMESDIRISNVAWIDISNTRGPLSGILPRVQDYTDLSTKQNHTEDMQVVNYGLGGYYNYHYDDETDGVSERIRGKRIATLLFYLSDVEAGGATVFTKAGIRVPPVKGSAVLWYNYFKNGDRDLNTRHAGCPVLMGTKWASNLWIREYGQVFRRKCGLTRDDKY